MANEPDIDEAEIDTGPLTLTQLRGLARDQMAALRHTVQEILNQEPRVDGESVLDVLDVLAATIAKET